MVDNAQMHKAYLATLNQDNQLRLEVVREASSLEVLSTAAPLAHELEAPAELVHAVLDSHLCTPSLASRYGAHPDASVRARLTTAQMLPGTLTMLTYDPDDNVRERARRALEDQAARSPARVS